MSLNGIDMTQWRLLAALAETSNLSAAAGRLGITQSAASHALARLRNQLGDALFVRASGGLTPTPYGTRLCRAAQSALETLRDGLAAAQKFDPATANRRFNIYLNNIGQLAFLPQLATLLAREAPATTLKVHQIATGNPGEALASGEVDLAVGFFTNLTAGFHQSLLYRTKYVCVVRKAHPLFRHGMSLDAFLKVEHAVADPSGMAHAVVERALAKHAIHRRVQLNVPDFVVLPMLIAETNLLVIMPSGLANAFSRRLPLKVLPPPIALPRYDLKVYWHERFHRDPANMWLRQNFVRLFRSSDTTHAWSSEFGSRQKNPRRGKR